MSCCGNNRSRFYATPQPRSSVAPSGLSAPPSTRQVAPIPIIFEYIGQTGLSAVGSVTGALYRFDQKNARVAIDPRDAPGIASVPNLRRAR
jgi:hypothetical protein